MKIGELFVQLGIKADTAKLVQFTEGLGGTVLKAAALVTALAGVSLAFKDVLQDAMNTSMALQQFEAQTGMSGQQLQRWQMMAERSGTSADAVTSSVEALQRAMTEIRLGGGNVKPFQMLGIDVNQSPFAALEQVRSRIKGMDRGMANNLVSQLGINPEMIRLLTMTNAQLRAMNGDDLIISDRNRKKFAETKVELIKLRQELTYFAQNFIASLIPTGKEFTAIILQWKDALKALGVVAIAVAAAFMPITAAIIGLILILQDLDTYTRGGDSVFGSLIDPIKKLADAFRPLGAALSPMGRVTGMTNGGGLYAPAGLTNAIAKHFSQTNNVRIDVKGGAPAKETAEATKREFDKAVDHAAAQIDNEGY